MNVFKLYKQTNYAPETPNLIPKIEKTVYTSMKASLEELEALVGNLAKERDQLREQLAAATKERDQLLEDLADSGR